MFGLAHPALPTGCSMHSRKTTLAVINPTTVEQLPAAIAMAAKVLKPALAINNSSQLAIFGSGLSDARPAAVKNVRMLKRLVDGSQTEISEGVLLDKIRLIVGAHDLTMLRFVPSVEYGELCRIPGCRTDTVECDIPPTIAQMDEGKIKECIDCLRRFPAVQFADADELPFDWAEYHRNVQTYDWLDDLWTSTVSANKRQEKSFVPTTVGESPFDVLSICMYAKMVVIACRTTEMANGALRKIVSSVDGADGLGLMAMFEVDGEVPSVLSFLSAYLVGDKDPWKVTPRGKAAAKKARVILNKVFDHATTVLDVLQHGQIADVVEPLGEAPSSGSSSSSSSSDGTKSAHNHSHKKKGVLLVHAGTSGMTAKFIVGRLPVGALASYNNKFDVAFKRVKEEDWVKSINADLKSVVDALINTDTAAPIEKRDKRSEVARIRELIAAYAVLASSHVNYGDEVVDETASTALSRFAAHFVTTFPNGMASHVSRELSIKSSVIDVAATSACVSVQAGTSVSCTFCTFCSTTMRALRGARFAAPSIEKEDINTLQAAVDTIAKAVDRPYRPLGMLSGTLGSVVRFNDTDCRVVYWRQRGEDRDALVTFFPRAYIDIVFADYATGSRNLRTSDSGEDMEPPFFVSDTIFSLSNASAIPGSMATAFSVPKLERLGTLGSDESSLYQESAKNVVLAKSANVELESKFSRSFLTFYVRELQDDLLAGLKVQWSRHVVHGSDGARKSIFALVSDNSSKERLLY